MAIIGSQALAQETGSTNDQMPDTWRSGLGDTFFSDSSGSTMRSNDEVTSRWGKLSADQQTAARTDCEKMYPSKGETALKPKTGGDSERTGGMASACQWIGSQK